MRKIKLLIAIILIFVGVFLIGYSVENSTDYVKFYKADKEYSQARKKYKKKKNYTKTLMNKNDDMIAYLRIPNTNVSYPIMQTIGNEEYYLNRNIEKNYNFFGTPFADERCSLNTSNLIVYGHNITRKRMFGELTNYFDYNYYKKHKTIYLETKNKKREYQIIGILKTNVNNKVYNYIQIENNDEFEEWLTYIKNKSIYNCDSVNKKIKNNQLLTLSTCGNTGGDTRILIISIRKT